MNDPIDWNEVESAVAKEDGLHVTKKDGTLGIVAVQLPGAANMQRNVWCHKMYDMLTTLSKHLNELNQLKGKPGIDEAIVATKAHIASLQDIIRNTGC